MPESNAQSKSRRFDGIATNVNKRVSDPSEAGVDYYVGLQHLEPDTLRIRSWGSPGEVSSTKLLFEPEDVIFGKRRAYQRKLGVAEFRGVASAHSLVLRARPEVMLPGFLPFFMQSDRFMDRAQQISVGSLSPTINWKALAKQEFVVPSLEWQHSALSVLEAFEANVEAHRAVVSSLGGASAAAIERLTQLHSVSISGDLVAPLPPGWRLGRVRELCKLSGGFGFRPKHWSSTGLPIIRIQNLNGSSDFNYFDGEAKPKWIVPPGELLFAWAGVPGVSFGPCLWPGPKGVLNQHIYRVTPNAGYSREWLYALLLALTPRIERKAHGFKKSLLHIKQADLLDENVPIPPQDEIDGLVSLAEEIQDGLDSARQRLSELQDLRQPLITMALDGLTEEP